MLIRSKLALKQRHTTDGLFSSSRAIVQPAVLGACTVATAALMQ
jgi:hypothetical protein